MSRTRTLQSSLFRSFSAVIVAIMILLIGFFFVYTRRILLRQSTQEIESISRVISADLDEEIRTIDQVSINAAYSEMVTEAFQVYLRSTGEVSLERRRQLAAATTAIVGPLVPVKQVYLHDLGSRRLAVGMINNTEAWDVTAMPWFNAVIEADGRKVLAGPSIDETLSSAYVNQENRLNIVLLRLFFDRYGTPVGIMELVQDATKVFLSATEYGYYNAGHIIVLNAAGNVIYPTDESLVLPEALATGIDRSRPDGSFRYHADDREQIAAFAISDYTGWTTIVAQDTRDVLSASNAFTVLTLMVIIPALLAVLAVSFLVSRRITRPLRLIHETIEGLDLVTISSETAPANMHLNELEELRQAVLSMRRKLGNSLAETIAAHQHESEARMQALQAQVNPHFMHNTINTLSAMAEERMYDDIVAMCRNVSSMMRYVADQHQKVSLRDELEYTHNYLETMKLRYRDQLEYSVAIDGDASVVSTPRLIIQPIAENSIKHGTTRRSPWAVSVACEVTGTGWTVRVRDDGPGFSSEVLERINRREYDVAPDDESGIGVSNILRRMTLWYGPGQFRFEVRNLEPGAEVLIGGVLVPDLRLAGNGDQDE